jgi:hypothetical protein
MKHLLRHRVQPRLEALEDGGCPQDNPPHRRLPHGPGYDPCLSQREKPRGAGRVARRTRLAHIHHHTLLVAMTAALAATSVYLALTRWAAGDLATLSREAGRAEAMNRRLAAARQLSEGKHRAVAELIVGRLTLRQAAERFGDLGALLDDGNDDVLGACQVLTGEEALFRSVYSWAVSELRDGPGSSAVLDRLAKEYRQQFGHDPQPLPEYASLPLAPPRRQHRQRQRQCNSRGRRALDGKTGPPKQPNGNRPRAAGHRRGGSADQQTAFVKGECLIAPPMGR